MSEDVPTGFEPLPRTSSFIKLIGPVYMRRDEQGIALGLRVHDGHLNNRGWVHGAVATALLDVVCARNIASMSDPPTPVVTASLTVDFIAPAGEGDWIEATAKVTRLGRRLAFCRAQLEANERTIAQATAVFAVVTPLP
jgi:uncharacterized protein (TIGR00369 family)